MTQTPERGSILFDARWIGIGGPGRVTEHMLEGLAEIAPAGRWTLWGPKQVEAYLWTDSELIPSRHHPHSLFGQREIRGPRSRHASVGFYPHQMRPLRRLCAIEITTIHDTIPFRYPPMTSLSPLMRVYLRSVARLSDYVATDSEFSRSSIHHDLRVDPSRIRVLPLSIDHEKARRIRLRRATTPRELIALYVGADLPHKNLDRLVASFALTSFQRSGGRLVLVGMSEASCRRLSQLAERSGTRATALGYVPERQLEDLMTSARLVVQPSLEEGFGLPVAEAMAAGIPVAASTGGSLPEITRGAINHFDPRDIHAIATAVDEASTKEDQPDLQWPRPRDLAQAVIDFCAEATRSIDP